MLFRVENVSKIIAGEKTVTRRVERANGSRPAVPGKIIEARTRLFLPEFVFAFLVIESVTLEKFPGELQRITRDRVRWARALHEEAHREGFATWREFEDAYEAMHGHAALSRPCWRVAFRLATMHETVCDGPGTRAARKLAWVTTTLTGDAPAICPWFEAVT